MKIALMNAGRAFLVQNASNPVKPRVDAFSVGTAAGFTPSPNGIGVTPTSIYEGNQAAIRKTIVSDNELILSAVFPNNLNLEKIGNILLKLNGTIPFIWFVLRQPFGKQAVNNEKHYGGDLQFQSMVLKIPGISNRLNLTDNPDHYASGKRFADINELPRPILAGSSEVVVDRDDSMFNKNRPVFGMRVNNEWWGIPGMKSLDDTRMGVLDGGVAGEGYGD